MSSIEGQPGYTIDRRTGIIYYANHIDGKKVHFSCRSKNIVAAKRFAAKKLKQLHHMKHNVGVPLMGSWMDRYVEYRKKQDDLSESAKRNSINTMKKAKPFFQDMRVEEFDEEIWFRYCDWHRDQYGGQLENAHKYIRNFLKWLSSKRVGERPVIVHFTQITNPEAKSVRRLRKEKKSRVFDAEEFSAIYQACDQRERLIVSLMYCMAFRIESDAMSARWDQFNLSAKRPVYRFGEFDNKAGLEGKQGIHSFVLDQMKEWKKTNGSGLYVFPQKSNLDRHSPPPSKEKWDKIKQKSGVDWNWTAHTFRHTCLTRLAENGHPMHLICKCFRISAKEFMETYAHLTEEGLDLMTDAMEVTVASDCYESATHGL